MKDRTEVAVYYYPNYHPDARNDRWHGKGWTEWELMKRAEPRFEGHNQPKLPLWGYEDESNPEVMARKIDAAADHGVSAFIFDWYWYEDGPFLQRGLEEGFLQAENADRLKFSLMWANHDWIDIHPLARSLQPATLASGTVSEKAFIEATDHMIRRYFAHPSYWRVKDGLYFSIYELMNLVKGFGGIEETKRILADFRERVRAAGLGELHLNAVVWGVQILPGEKRIEDPNELLNELAFDSVTSYVWLHHVGLPEFPQTDYGWWSDQAIARMKELADEFRLPYFPNVTMGWDTSPRTVQSDKYEPIGYQYMATVSENTPARFEEALRRTKALIESKEDNPQIVTINAWNEWTEGSYLEPDTVNGTAYLEAVKAVFGSK
ncbi:glycosyltransferase WbsX family protein [Cohnella silvisoli]|uniref:Glycoside hydrolase family 99-like domain-containing protein n=1 Tax=Cohnella silvisoli TaxID=2873699 RepID=A0ABV1KS36_9BACL|nr:glycoside hydrolase family 99-like domain-containing protein [Cohnella silvisoli]MCD9022496.1 glycoside hydrolase family 99-like domain-containing protein [Cohnella silvisoli]